MAGSFGSSSGSSDDELITGINVTPLVDVVLVLLVIFMMTAPVIYQSAIKVQLPKAKSGEQNDAKSLLTFTITQEGNVLWGSESIGWDALEARLQSMRDKNAEQTAFINADEATPHGTVVRLMDVLRQAGLTRFALNVDHQQ